MRIVYVCMYVCMYSHAHASVWLCINMRMLLHGSYLGVLAGK